MSNKENRSRSANGIGSIRKKTITKKSGKQYEYWEGRVTLGFDSDGKQVQKSVSGKTQSDVVKKIKQLAASADTSAYVPAPSNSKDMTVKMWLTTWCRDYLNHVASGTAFEYKKKCDRYLIPYIGEIKLEKLKAPQIQKCINTLNKAKTDGGAGLSAKSIKDVYGVLHRALEQALILGYINRNPSIGCSLPRVEAPQIRLYTEDELIQFLNAIEGHTHEIYYKLLIFSGIREAEGLGLTWDAVDFGNGCIHINKQLVMKRGENERCFGAPKDMEYRTIFLPASVMELLKIQQRRESKKAALCGNTWAGLNLVFSNPFGGFLSRQTVYTCYKRVVSSIGIPDVSIHALRHAYTALAFANGDDPRTVQANLGHATPDFTQRVYAYSTPGMRKGSAERMDNRFREMTSGTSKRETTRETEIYP